MKSYLALLAIAIILSGCQKKPTVIVASAPAVVSQPPAAIIATQAPVAKIVTVPIPAGTGSVTTITQTPVAPAPVILPAPTPSNAPRRVRHTHVTHIHVHIHTHEDADKPAIDDRESKDAAMDRDDGPRPITHN